MRNDRCFAKGVPRRLEVSLVDGVYDRGARRERGCHYYQDHSDHEGHSRVSDSHQFFLPLCSIAVPSGNYQATLTFGLRHRTTHLIWLTRMNVVPLKIPRQRGPALTRRAGLRIRHPHHHRLPRENGDRRHRRHRPGTVPSTFTVVPDSEPAPTGHGHGLGRQWTSPIGVGEDEM